MTIRYQSFLTMKNHRKLDQNNLERSFYIAPFMNLDPEGLILRLQHGGAAPLRMPRISNRLQNGWKKGHIAFVFMNATAPLPVYSAPISPNAPARFFGL